MSPLPVWLGVAAGVVIGWLLSGTWRGTTKRGYLLALDHVEMTMRSKMNPRTLDETIRKLREDTK